LHVRLQPRSDRIQDLADGVARLIENPDFLNGLGIAHERDGSNAGDRLEESLGLCGP